MAGLWYLRAPFGTNKPAAPVHPADCCTSGRPPPFILAQATQCLLITGASAPANPYLSAHMQNPLGRQLNVCVSMNPGKCISANTITAHGQSWEHADTETCLHSKTIMHFPLIGQCSGPPVKTSVFHWSMFQILCFVCIIIFHVIYIKCFHSTEMK